MRLDSSQFVPLRDELLSAFPTPSDLERFALAELDVRLDAIAKPGNLTERVSELIKWSEDQARVDELIARAPRASGRAALRALSDQLLQQLAAAAAADPRARLRAERLDALLANWEVDSEARGARRVRSRARRYFQSLLDDHRVFGGRGPEMARLDSFAAGGAPGYMFVTGTSGFGKTALLANWSQALAARGQDAAVHFITPRVDVAKSFCFQSLCEQLMQFHRLGGELPTAERDLPLFYADLLQLPPPGDRHIVVVVDGLDEALGYWDPGPEMFPAELAEGIHVVFSARTIAARDWLAELHLALPPAQVLRLGQLAPDGIRDVLLQSGAMPAADGPRVEQATDRLYKLSEGDPFYLKDLLTDLKESGGDLDGLAAYPIGHNTYLAEWWTKARTDDPAFVDLMGTLAVLHDPLGRAELIDVSDDDNLRGATFDKLIRLAARYLVGDDRAGYQLSHRRIKELVLDRLQDEIDTYRGRLADYCLRWREPRLSPQARDYMLAHAVQHLVDAGRVGDIPGLLSPEWIRAKWDRFGSYAALGRDLDVAALAAWNQEPRDYAGVVALAVARQTARESMLDLPTSLLVAWLRLGHVEPVLALLGSLGAGRGRAVEPLIAAAGELLAARARGATPASLDLAQAAADVLGRAVTMLPELRFTKDKVKAFDQIVGLLGPNALTEAQRVALLGQIEGFAQAAGESVLRAVLLARAAAGWAELDAYRTRAQYLVDQAREAIARTDFAPDRSHALLCLLPALHYLDPGTVVAAARSAFEPPVDPFARPTLGEGMLIDLLAQKLGPLPSPAKDELADWLAGLGEQAAGEENAGGTGRVALALAAFGRPERGIALIDDLARRSPVAAPAAAIPALAALHPANPAAAEAWLALAAPSDKRLLPVLAALGRWDRVFGVLDDIVPEADDLVGLAGDSLPRDAAALRDIAERLLTYAGNMSAEDRSRLYAALARELALLDPAAARAYAATAAGLSLADLPEGSGDDLRLRLAVALQQAGDVPAAREAIARMAWTQEVLDACIRLIRVTPATEPDALAGYADDIVNRLDSEQGDVSFQSYLRQAAAAAWHLAERLPAAAERLCDYVVEHGPDWYGAVAQAAARTRFDPQTGLAHLDHYFGWLARQAQVRPDEADALAVTLIEHLGTIVPVAPDEAAARLEQVYALPGLATSTKDRVKLGSAFAAAIAGHDPDRAVAVAREQMALVAQMGRESAGFGALNVIRMISDLTGKLVGHRFQQTDAALEAGAAVVALAPHCPEAIAGLFDELLAVVRTIDSAKDRAEALAGLFDRWAGLPSGAHPALAAVYDAALAQAPELPEPNLTGYVLTRAARFFAGIGDQARAQTLAGQVPDPDDRDSILNDLELAAGRSQLGDLSPLEQVYLDVRRNHEIYYAAIGYVREGQAVEVLDALVEPLAYDRIKAVRVDLMDHIRLVVLPACAVGGPALLSSIIDGIEAWDRRFVEAASVIAAAGS